MKLLLTTLNSKYVHTNLALRYLYQGIPDRFNAVLKEFTINEELFRILAGINEIESDIIAFSCYIWNISYTLRISECIKKVKPKTIIIFGGPEVSHDTKEFMANNSFIDYVVLGEGEEIFPKLLESIANLQGDLDSINGIAFRNERDSIIVNGEYSIVNDLSVVSSPYQSNITEYKNRVTYFESTRGCPYNCSYCLSSTTKGVRHFPIERVKADLRRIIEAGAKQIKFVDRTFNCDRKWAMDIWGFLIENKKDTTFHFEIAGHLIDDEMIDFLSQVPEGYFQFEIGVQSTNEKTIEAINRKTDFDKLSYVIRRLRGNGNINIHLDLIAGLPYETYEGFAESFNNVYSLKPHALQLGFLKLLKGSNIREKWQDHGYKWIAEPPYEVIENKYITFNEIIKLKRIEEVLEIYKNSGRYEYSLKFILDNYYESPFAFFEDLAMNWQLNGAFERKAGVEEAYDILFGFYIAKEWKEEEYFREVLKMDYYLSFWGASARPWMKRYTVPKMKELIHDFLSDDNFIQEYVPEANQLSWSDKLKLISFEVFKFNILDIKYYVPVLVMYTRNFNKNAITKINYSIIESQKFISKEIFEK